MDTNSTTPPIEYPKNNKEILKMKVSIVIPVYNVESYIEDCLKSVAAQTYKGEIECIIVNDCTPDGSCAIIEQFIKEYNGNIEFKLLHHTINRGLSAARNTGIDAATGEYIYFLDSDDEITPECIELLVEPLKNKKYDFVIGNYETVDSDVIFPQLLVERDDITTNEEIRNQYFKGNWYMMAWNKLCYLGFIRKEELYFKEGLINEDELWSFKLACTAQSMYAVTSNTYKYKIRETSIMGSINQTRTADTFSTVTNEAYKWVTQKGIIYNKDIFNRIIWFREFVFGIILSQKTSKEKRILYLKCYKRLRIAPWKAYKSGVIKRSSLIKELYNYMPGIFGYWYLSLYNKILKR